MAAVQYAHARYINRKGGGSATRSAAYNGRDRILDERTQQLHKFEPDPKLKPDDKQYREKPIYHDVLLPDGVADAFKNPSVLWNAAELAERRINSQVVREVLLALPNAPEVSERDWIEMATTFAQEHFVSKGLAVQVDIHNESRHPEAGKQHNPHCHLLISTRYLTPEGFGAKARDLQPTVRSFHGKGRIREAEAWGETWRQHQNAHFEAHGYEVRVEPIALEPLTRLRMIGRDDKAAEALRNHLAEHRQRNAEAARDPAKVLARLQETYGASFGTRELNQFLRKHLPDAAQRTEVRAAVQAMAHGTNENWARRYEIQMRSLRPWMLKTGGADALDRFDADAAWRAYSRWAERKGTEAKTTFEAYVSFVQKRWAAHPENREALVKRANENADPWQRAERRERRAPGLGRGLRIDSQYNRGGGWYDEDTSYGRRM